MERKINQLPDNNMMPEIHLFDSFKDVAIAIGSSVLSYLSMLPREPLSRVSEHFSRNNDEILAERMMERPEALEAFEQLKFEYENKRQWSQYPTYDDESWDVV